MQVGRKSKCSLKELFTAFLFLRNKETNIAQDPKGENIVIYLRNQLRFKTSFPVYQRIEDLIKLGYIEKYCYNGEALFSVKLLKLRWQEPEPQKKLKLAKPKIKKLAEQLVKKELVADKPEIKKQDKLIESAPVVSATPEKRFAVLIDWQNLRKHVNDKKLRDFSWLWNPILREGEIEAVFVFIPDHLIYSAPLRTLSNHHRFLCLTAICPPKSENGIAKEKDSVDNRLVEFGKLLTRHKDITNVVIVAGDGDFQDLKQAVVWRNKTVKVVSAADAISSNFLFDEQLEKQIVL